jgi:hypothetical protein
MEDMLKEKIMESLAGSDKTLVKTATNAALCQISEERRIKLGEHAVRIVADFYAGCFLNIKLSRVFAANEGSAEALRVLKRDSEVCLCGTHRSRQTALYSVCGKGLGHPAGKYPESGQATGGRRRGIGGAGTCVGRGYG